MKALITKVTFKGEKEGKFGMEYNYSIEYDGKKAYFTCKKSDQQDFIENQECEFTEEEKTSGQGNKYFIVKPIKQAWKGQSGYGKAIKKEQSKYSGFAVSYVKDLIIAGKIELKDLEKKSTEIFDLMVKLDKTIEQ